jgi:uncharacterized protein YxjI
LGIIFGSKTPQGKESTSRRQSLRLRKTPEFEDTNGRKLAQIKEHLFNNRDSKVIENAHVREVATVRKSPIAPLRDEWNLSVKGGEDLVVQCNILDLEYSMKLGRNKFAEVSKK